MLPQEKARKPSAHVTFPWERQLSGFDRLLMRPFSRRTREIKETIRQTSDPFVRRLLGQEYVACRQELREWRRDILGPPDRLV